MARPRDDHQKDLLRSALDEITDLGHPLVRLARQIDFCGELSFCHRWPFDRSSLTRWRQLLGEVRLVALIQESLSVAHKDRGAGDPRSRAGGVYTTIQPKAIAHPTDARLCHRAEKRVELAQRHHVPLRQSYRRVAKRAALMVGRYTHAHQFKRAVFAARRPGRMHRQGQS